MTVKSWRRIATWTIRLLLLALVGVLAFAITVLTILPRATHGVALTVLTGSMTPGIPVGSIVVDRPVDPGTLHVGDIATYQKEPGKAEYITHRIIKIDASKTPTMFTFKGDANRGPDMEPVPATAIRGKVWFHVPHLGAFRDTLHTKGGLAGVAMVLLAGYALVQAASALGDRQRAVGDPTASTTSRPTHRVPVVDDRGRSLIVAQLPLVAFQSLNARSALSLLGATLIKVDETTMTITLPERPGRMQERLDQLQAFHPVTLHVAAPNDDQAASRLTRLRREVLAGV